MDPVKSIQIVINTLDKVEVRGKANMDYLLGAIFSLERVIETLTEATQAEAEQKGE